MPADLSATLAKAGLSGVESWAFADTFTKRLEYDIDPHWRGELPLRILLGRDGSSRSILGNVDFTELHAWIDGEKGTPALNSRLLTADGRHQIVPLGAYFVSRRPQ